MNIGDKIKQLRVSCGLTQTDVAKVINSTKQTIFKYENSIITNIPLDKIEIMAHLFNVTPMYLVGWSDYPEINTSENEPIILHKYNRLDLIDKSKAESYIDGLLTGDKYNRSNASINDDNAATITAAQEKKL